MLIAHAATDVEGIFRLSGSAKRIKDLQQVFNTPDRYGKGLDWNGYTVHDAANILRRYLNQLPEPIVPLDFYERFRQPLRAYQANGVRNPQLEAMEVEEHTKTVRAYQQLITELPPLNRQLLLYILDLLAVFASKADLNRMNAQNLAAIFQPGIISHPKDDMAPSEYRLSQDVLIFLIENQDHFLIGMNGTAMDQKTKDEVKSGAPSIRNQSANNTVARSTSNASAGADSLRKSGGLRRNASLSSHNSRDRASPNVSTPGTPASPSNITTAGASGSLGRSNTVPSNRSPAMPGTARFQRMADASQAASPVSAHPNSISGPSPIAETPATYANIPGTDVRLPSSDIAVQPSLPPQEPRAPVANVHDPVPEPAAAVSAAQELKPTQDSIMVTPLDTKPASRDRKISNLLSISPMFGPSDAPKDPNQRQPRKLQKRRIPGTSLESAQSSQASLNAADEAMGFHTPLATPNHVGVDRGDFVENQQFSTMQPTLERSHEPPTSQTAPREVRNISTGLKPPLSPTPSIHSKGSATDPSDLDALEDPVTRAEKKRHRFTLSKQDSAPLAPPPSMGQLSGARASNSSLGSNRPRKSFTGESQLTQTSGLDASSSSYPSAANVSSRESTELYKEHYDPEKKGFFGRIKAKMQQSRDERDRAKSPPRLQPEHGSRSSLSAFTQEHLSPRGRSFDKSQEGSLGVVDERQGHSRTGSRTPIPPPPAQWSSTAPGSAPVSATPYQTMTPASTIQSPAGPVSAPVSAAPLHSSAMPTSLHSNAAPIGQQPHVAPSNFQDSRIVPVLASEPERMNLVSNLPEGQTIHQRSETLPISAESDRSSKFEPTPVPARMSVHDQVAPTVADANVAPHRQTNTSAPNDTETVANPAPATSTNPEH